MYDGSDRRDVRKAERAAKAAQQADNIVVTSIMATQSGRAWMFRKLSLCQLQNDGYADIPNRTYFMAGQRNIGLQLQEEILRACPDQYIAMLRESNVRDAADDARRSRDHEERGRVDSSAADEGGDESGTGFDEGNENGDKG